MRPDQGVDRPNKSSWLHLRDIASGPDLFRIASVCLYITMLLHFVLQSVIHGWRLSDLNIISVTLLTSLFFLALGRRIWPDALTGGQSALMLELGIAVFVIASLATKPAASGLPLPWLIALAGIFPLALDAPQGLIVTLVLAVTGCALNVTLGALFSEWLPHLFATLFVGLSAGILAKTLHSNFEALQRAHTNERRFREIARVARHMFMIVDSGFRILYSNRALQEIIGYSQQEIALHNIKPTVHPEDEKTHHGKLRYLRDTPKSSICSRLRVKHRDGRWIWLEARGYNMLHDEAICGLVFSIEDISARKDAELKLEEEQRLLQHLAMHDPLTGLPNRRYLQEMVADAMERAQEQSQTLAMLLCDLDFFKSVNDTHGHEFGDKCLMEITRRIRAEMPSGDFVARFGGNEFVVLSQSGLQEAKAKAEILLNSISRQLEIDDAAVKIQTSIGIALLDSAHKNPSDLIRDADAAVYQAKERGRNRAEIFDASLQSISTRRAQMDVALRFALEREEFAIAYQPKVCIASGEVKGFELLLRWNNPRYGAISPMDFIPVAESSGLVVEIGLWALEQACKQLASWRNTHPASDNITVAVNVSMRQLLHASFIDEVKRILQRTGVPPRCVELELTETSAMANPVQTIETLTRLKQLGLRLALDDFGTGYSSLAYLQKLPIDVLKIDKAFVRGIDRNPGDAEIVRLILALARAMNLDTVAEGVETQDDMLQLKNMGCRLAQGFAFSPPVSAESAGELLRTAQQYLVA
jgi:diguanylate cyclase (GGDEF)-like protein/PAS domain S-box-containing protein